MLLHHHDQVELLDGNNQLPRNDFVQFFPPCYNSNQVEKEHPDVFDLRQVGDIELLPEDVVQHIDLQMNKGNITIDHQHSFVLQPLENTKYHPVQIQEFHNRFQDKDQPHTFAHITIIPLFSIPTCRLRMIFRYFNSKMIQSPEMELGVRMIKISCR
jgi:hypothetical protein